MRSDSFHLFPGFPRQRFRPLDTGAILAKVIYSNVSFFASVKTNVMIFFWGAYHFGRENARSSVFAVKFLGSEDENLNLWLSSRYTLEKVFPVVGPSTRSRVGWSCELKSKSHQSGPVSQTSRSFGGWSFFSFVMVSQGMLEFPSVLRRCDRAQKPLVAHHSDRLWWFHRYCRRDPAPRRKKENDVLLFRPIHKERLIKSLSDSRHLH